MIGLNIKILRTENCMTHDEFANKINVSARALRRWESGEREPAIKYVKRIVDEFDVQDIYYFMFGDKNINEIPKEYEIPKLVYIL